MLYILYIFRTSFSMIHIKELRINTVSILYIFQGDIKEVKTQLSQLKISMTLPVLSYRLSKRSNHSAICLLTWADLMRSSRFTWMGRSNAKSWLQFHSIHAKAGQCGNVIERHLWEKDIQDLGLLETLEKQAKSVHKAFLQVAVVPVVFRAALNMVHH